jgi:hypothetical protein
VGNEEGLQYAERRVQIEQQLSLVQQRLSTSETEKYRLLDRIDVLELGRRQYNDEGNERLISEHLQAGQAVETIECIFAGNVTAHMAVTQSMTQHCTIVGTPGYISFLLVSQQIYAFRVGEANIYY